MSSRVFEVLQQMLKLRKDRSVAQSKRVQAEYDRVRNFNLQVTSYANEYESQWVKAAQQARARPRVAEFWGTHCEAHSLLCCCL